MARNKMFDATNKPNTCLWCGKRLTQVVEHTLDAMAGVPRTQSACCRARVYTDDTGEWRTLRCERCHEIQSSKVYRRSGTPTGRYGEDGDGLFCRTRCGYQFGRALALHGRRLQPVRDNAETHEEGVT